MLLNLADWWEHLTTLQANAVSNADNDVSIEADNPDSKQEETE